MGVQRELQDALVIPRVGGAGGGGRVGRQAGQQSGWIKLQSPVTSAPLRTGPALCLIGSIYLVMPLRLAAIVVDVGLGLLHTLSPCGHFLECLE